MLRLIPGGAQPLPYNILISLKQAQVSVNKIKTVYSTVTESSLYQKLLPYLEVFESRIVELMRNIQTPNPSLIETARFKTRAKEVADSVFTLYEKVIEETCLENRDESTSLLFDLSELETILADEKTLGYFKAIYKQFDRLWVFDYQNTLTWVTAKSLQSDLASLIESTPEDKSFLKVKAKYLHILGTYFATVEGNPEKALQYLSQALPLRKMLLGERSAQVAETLNNLGTVYDLQGDQNQALQHHTEAFEIREVVFGKNSAQAAESLNNMGAALRAAKDLEVALAKHQHSLAIKKRIYGNKHPSVATSLNNLGIVYQEQQKYELAINTFTEALAIHETAFGRQHPAVAQDLSNLGAALGMQGRTPQALEHLNESLTIRKSIFGPNHPEVAASLNHLGVAFYIEKQYTQSAKHFTEALAIYKQAYGEDNPEYISTLEKVKRVTKMLA